MSIAQRTYRDMAFSMFANPMNGDIGKKEGADAVKGAILSILKTDFNERVFQPELGCGVRGLLFVPMNPVTAELIKQEVESAVLRHESRAIIVGVSVKPIYDENRYDISVLFRIASTSQVEKVETTMEAV